MLFGGIIHDNNKVKMSILLVPCMCVLINWMDHLDISLGQDRYTEVGISSIHEGPIPTGRFKLKVYLTKKISKSYEVVETEQKKKLMFSSSSGDSSHSWLLCFPKYSLSLCRYLPHF